MTDVKKLQTRIALKYDSYANWTDETKEGLGANLVLLKGEIGLCEIPSGNSSATTAPTVLFKVGDGTTPFKTLKWASALAADVYGWAKASDVVLEGKTIKFVGTDKTITLEYLTEAEINAKIKVVSDNLAGVEQRVAAIEGSIGTGAVATDIADLKSRMTAAEGDIDTLESTKLDASVFTAFNNGEAKSVSAIETAYKAYADQAEADAKSYADGIVASEKSARESKEAAIGSRIDAIVAADTGAIAVAKAEAISDAAVDATSKANAAEAAAKSYAETKASEAKAGAEKTASDALAAAVQTLNVKDAELVAKDAALEASIGENKTAIEKEVTDRGTAITNAVNDVTSAYTTVIGTAKTELEGKITAEETARTNAINALTKTVTDNADDAASEIARVEGLIEDEAKARDDADKALDARLDKVETFFEGAYTEDGQPVKEALDTLVEIQNYITGEGEAASALLDAIEANATAIEGLSDRMDTAEDDIDSLEGRATAVENRATALETITGGVVEGEANGAIKNAIEAAHGLAQTAFNNAATAQAAAEAADAKAQTAQNEVDALEGVVAGVKETAEDAQSRVAAVEGVLNGTNNDGLVKDVADLKTASATHATKTYVDEELAKKVDKDSYATDKQGIDAALEARYTKTEADGKFGLKTDVAQNATDIATNASNIAANTANIAANTTAIGAEETRALAQEAAIRSEFATADQGIYSKIGDVGTGTVAKAISDAQTAAQTYADGKVEALEKGAVATNASNISAVSGRVDAIEEKFMGWFVIDCGNSTTVIDETK